MQWDIIGHKNQISFIRNMVDNNQLPHALLFSGQKGIGKAAVAAVLAQTLLCEEGQSYPCGRCRSCLEAVSTHPDLFILEPEGAFIKIDQIRNVQSELVYRPSWGKKKVFIIDPVDAMTEQAQNCLLKSLEDTPDYAVFILIAHTQQAVLPTVRSRCMQIRFNPICRSEIEQALTEKGFSDPTARMLGGICCGSLSYCLENDPDLILNRRHQVAEWIEKLIKEPVAVWVLGEALEKEKENLTEYIDLFILWYRDILRAKLGLDDDIINKDSTSLIRQAASIVSLAGIAWVVKALLDLKINVRNNANLRLAIDVALIQMKRGMQSA
jgi:DNA polymerase-3 subunit delta'